MSHGVSFFQNFIGRAEYVDRDIREEMGKPYDRIFMQFTLILGGFLVGIFDSTLLVLLLLIVLKITTDLRAHLVEHRIDPNPK